MAANLPCCCCCAAILVYCSIRDWTRICVIGLKNIRINPYKPNADLFSFSTSESRFKNIRIRCRIRRMRVDGSRIRKEKVEIFVVVDSKLILRKHWIDTCNVGFTMASFHRPPQCFTLFSAILKKYNKNTPSNFPHRLRAQEDIRGRVHWKDTKEVYLYASFSFSYWK